MSIILSCTHLSSLSPAVSPGLARSCWVARGSWRQLAVVSGRGCSCCCCFSRYFLYLMLVLRTLSAIVAQSRLVLAAFSSSGEPALFRPAADSPMRDLAYFRYISLSPAIFLGLN